MLMFRNSVRAVDLFNLPPETYVEVGRQIEILGKPAKTPNKLVGAKFCE